MNKNLRLLSLIFSGLMLLMLTAGCNKKDDGAPTDYAIDFNIQGYLFRQTDDGRQYVEDAVFSARNPAWPDELKHGEAASDTTAFEYISLRGFPLIKNETALSAYTRDTGNGLLEVKVSKSGGIRDKETGEMKLITEAQYILFIDKETESLLLCQIFAEMDGEYQQYFFSPNRNPDRINDILIKAYTS